MLVLREVMKINTEHMDNRIKFLLRLLTT